MKHTNNGQCPKCQAIFERYPGFNDDLREWFEKFQARYPETHISCAGRGKEEQELCFEKGTSRARWGQSAHNWNAALDLFVLLPQTSDIYPREWFYNILAPNLPEWIEWYGRPGAKFKELPHIELKNWRVVKEELLYLVE